MLHFMQPRLRICPCFLPNFLRAESMCFISSWCAAPAAIDSSSFLRRTALPPASTTRRRCTAPVHTAEAELHPQSRAPWPSFWLMKILSLTLYRGATDGQIHQVIDTVREFAQIEAPAAPEMLRDISNSRSLDTNGIYAHI